MLECDGDVFVDVKDQIGNIVELEIESAGRHAINGAVAIDFVLACRGASLAKSVRRDRLDESRTSASNNDHELTIAGVEVILTTTRLVAAPAQDCPATGPDRRRAGCPGGSNRCRRRCSLSTDSDSRNLAVRKRSAFWWGSPAGYVAVLTNFLRSDRRDASLWS
jgi:hypothetical protein